MRSGERFVVLVVRYQEGASNGRLGDGLWFGLGERRGGAAFASESSLERGRSSRYGSGGGGGVSERGWQRAQGSLMTVQG